MRSLEGMLFEIRALDAVAYGSVMAITSVAVFVASYVPARRATRLAPLEALRDGRA